MISDKKKVHNLQELLDKIKETEDHNEEVSIDAVLNHVGRRSFGPILLLIGVLMAAPVIGDIPGVPSIMGILLLFVAIQLVLQRNYFWFPQWILNLSINREKLNKSLSYLYTPARYIDKLLKPRWEILTNTISTNVMAIICILIALSTPLMEVVPMSANLAGMVVLAFGLSLMFYDGVLALVAYLFSLMTFGLLIFY